MKIELRAESFAGAAYAAEGVIAAAMTDAMRDTALDAKQELRDQVTGAGLGTRLANTWRGDVYPQSARSTHPAGVIRSKAPLIVDSFLRGAQIFPVNGAKYLAIPTKNVPRAGGRRGSTHLMTPVEVEAVFNQDLIIKPGRAGHLLAFVDAIKGKNGRGFRGRTKGRLAGGRKSQLVLMFTLVKSVRMPKLLDLDGPAKRWAASFQSAVARRLAAS